MKRRNARNKAKDVKGPLKIVVGSKIILALLALATLCVCAVAQEETADELFKKGRDLDRNGSYEEAVKAYNRAIELEPNNATLYTAIVLNLNTLAFIANNQSKRNESMKAVDKALQIDPGNPLAWELKGEVLSQMEKYNESVDAYDKAIKNIGSYRQDIHANQTEFLSYIWTSKSISLWQLVRYNESLAAVDKAVQIDPAGNYDAWVFKGQLLASLGRYNESLQAFEGAAATETADSRPEIRALPWAAEGYVLMQMGRYEEADGIYQKIVGLNLTDEGADRRLANAWCGRGNALASLEKYNESLQAFDKAIGLNSEIALYAWTGKGDALLASDRYDEAIIAYDRALELYPEFADAGFAHAQKEKGDSLTKLGKREEALAAYGAAVVASDKAITAFNNATPLDRAISFTFDPYPLDQKFWIDRGSALKALGREDEAKDAYENATRLNPNYAEAWFDKGLVLLALNRDVEADAAFAIARKVGYSAEPQFLRAPPVVTNVTSLGNDEFIELANNENVAQGFRNLRLIADGDENKSIVLPDFTLEPGQKIRIHFGQGESNQTDLYLGSEIDLNDTAGNLTLRDSIRGIETGYMEYWTPPAQENAAEYWLEKGQELGRNGSYEEAVKAYDNALELDEKNAEAWLGKGTVLSLWAGSINDKSLYEDAIKAFDKAIELDPQQTRGRLVKASALLNLGRYNESLKTLDEAIETASQNSEKAQIWFEKAHLFAEQGNYNETTKSLEMVFELAPQDIDHLINGGILLSAVLGRNDDALKYYERAILIDPGNKLAWINKANALVRLNRTDEATEAYQEALNITNKSLIADPEDSDLWAEKGLLLHNVGNSDEAVKAFANATRIDPGDETSWKMMGVLLASELYRYDEAAQAFDGALQANPKDGQVWSLKADALKALGKSVEAEAAYVRAKVLGYKG